jgi:hypothetical protein
VDIEENRVEGNKGSEIVEEVDEDNSIMCGVRRRMVRL